MLVIAVIDGLMDLFYEAILIETIIQNRIIGLSMVRFSHKSAFRRDFRAVYCPVNRFTGQ